MFWTVTALIFPAAAAAQQQSPQRSNVPVLASGQMPSATPQSETEFTNVLIGSVDLSTYYDSDAMISAVPGRQRWDVGYGVMPRLTFKETLPRFDWSLTYGPGLRVSQNVNYRNTFAQDLGGSFDWLLTQHNVLSMQESYIRTTDPFASLQNAPGPTISPNQTIFIPNILRQTSVTNGVFSHEFSPHTHFGLGGAFSSTHFDRTPHNGPKSALIYSQIASGQAYISHDFSATNQLGFQYGAQVLRFPQADARTTVHSFLVFDQIRMTPNVMLTIYGGPEYSLTFNQVELNLGIAILTIPVRANQWSPVAGAILKWQGEHTGVVVNYARRISDGGGLVGAVEMNSGSIDLQYDFTRRWSLTSRLSAADNQLLAVKNAGNELMTYSADIGLSRELSRHLTLKGDFRRLNETGGLGNILIGNHNLGNVSLTYSFMRPLGR